MPLLTTVILLLVGLSACGQSAATGTSTQNTGPVVIGISLPLTGASSADGKATQQGYALWQAAINKSGGLLGHQVQLTILDDNSAVAQTQANYERLIATDHVNFVLGPFNDPPTVAGAQVAARHGYAFLEGIGTSPSTFQHGLNNLFSVSLSATKYLGTFERYVLSLPAGERPRTVAYATANDSFTQPQIDAVRPLLEQGGLTTTFYNIFDEANTDYSLVAQKVVASHADVVILGTQGVPDSAPFIKTFVQQHYNPKMLLATAGPDQGSAFTDAIGKQNTEGLLVPNGGWWPSIQTFGNAQFVQSYTATYGGTPDDISSDTVQAYSVGQVLQQAVTRAQSLDNGKLMEVLRQGTYQSLQGQVQFSADGQNRTATAYLFQWQKGQLVPVYPSTQVQATMEYPKPAWPS
jgi:branched-chain amino acid transport system substrate-binding protein